VLGQFTGEDQPDGGLDLSGRDGRSVVVDGELGSLGGDSLEDVGNERVEDAYDDERDIEGQREDGKEDDRTEKTHSWPCWRYQCRGGPASTPCRCTKSKTRSKEDQEASSSVSRSRLIANTRSETHPLGLLLLLVSTLSLGGGGLGSLSGSLGSRRGLGGGTGRGRGLREAE
jgi:hypothetical protein